jgi:hypothetical protein
MFQSARDHYLGNRMKPYNIKLDWLLCIELLYSVYYQVIESSNYRKVKTNLDTQCFWLSTRTQQRSTRYTLLLAHDTIHNVLTVHTTHNQALCGMIRFWFPDDGPLRSET